MKVGDLVSAHAGRLKGVITSTKGGHNGELRFFLSSFSLLPQGGWFSGDELTAEPEPEPLAVGTKAKLYGHDGSVIGHDPETGTYVFAATITLKSGLVRAQHVYPQVPRGDFLKWNLSERNPS